MAKTPYDIDLDRNPANFQPLTPLQFLERSAAVYPEHVAIIHGKLRRNYRDFYARARRLASALAKARHQEGRHGLGRARQYAADAGSGTTACRWRAPCSTRSTRGSMPR